MPSVDRLTRLQCLGMRLLVLGGTVFLGRHLVAAALARGHEVTLFNRGRSGPLLFPGAERLTGDRDGGLDQLRGRRWDAVVDTCGYVPRVVRQSVELLRDAANVYTFVSSISVYPLQGDDRSESGPVERLDDPASEDVRQHYGALKALCEEAVADCFGERTLIVRPGLIVGPHDPTGRFTYWSVRLGRTGEVLGPGEPDRRVQFIDARDLAAWTLDMVEAARAGTFNATGPARPLTFGELLSRCAGPVTWVPDDFLLEQGVEPYSELPLWVPPSIGTLDAPIDRALAAGLRHRDLDETIRDTRVWAESLAGSPAQTDAGGRQRQPAGISPEREAEILARWHAQRR
jgi:nucleoside-diphosphate-sugar epimerase